MPPKAKLPAPIDRPLSKAYVREFTGWATADPPGISDPTSLREMDNVLITSHTANTATMAVPELAAQVERNVRAFAAGAPLQGLVDVAAGY